MPRAVRISSQTLITAVLLLMLALSGVILARITWMFFYPESLLHPVAVDERPDLSRSSESAARAAGFSELARLSVLGSAAGPAPVRRDAPDTQLNWTLKGVLSDPDPRRSAAIMALQGQGDKAYRVGAALPGNVTLEEIHSDRVILSRAGQLETLRLRRAELNAGGARNRSAARRPVVEPLPSAEPDLTLADDGGIARIDREGWMNDPNRFLDVVSASPVLVDGRVYGLEVRPGRNAREFAAAGLQPGDVVTSVEGRPVAEINDYRDVLQELTGSSSVSLSVERNGEPVNITISMD